MIKRLVARTLVAGIVVAGGAPAAIAQTPASKPVLSTAPLQSQLKHEIARMTGLNPNEIEVRATNAMIRVMLVNTGYNDDPPQAREYLASTVSALVNKNAETDSRFKLIVVLHVEFVKRGLGFTKFIDSVEFRRGTHGSFERHQT